MDKIDFNANPLTFFNNYILSDKLPSSYRKSIDRESNTFFNYIDKEGDRAYNYIVNFQKCSNEDGHKTRVLHFSKKIENLIHKQATKELRFEVIEVLEKVLSSLDIYLAENYNIYPKEELREKIRVNHNLFVFVGNITTFQIALFYTILEETKEFVLPQTKFNLDKYKIIADKYVRNVKEVEKKISLVKEIIKNKDKIRQPTKKGLKKDIDKVLKELKKYDNTINILEPLEPQSEKSYPKSISLANDLLKKLD